MLVSEHFFLCTFKTELRANFLSLRTLKWPYLDKSRPETVMMRVFHEKWVLYGTHHFSGSNGYFLIQIGTYWGGTICQSLTFLLKIVEEDHE